MTDPATAGRSRSRLSLVLVVVLFALPVAGAWLLHALGGGWHGSGTTNHGELIVPARPLEPFSLPRLAGGPPLALRDLRGRWTLVYIAPDGCDAACETNLYKMRQVRLALGKDMDRVQRLLVVVGAAPADLKSRLQDYPGTMVAAGGGDDLARFTAQFEVPGRLASAHAGRLDLVDPLGNFMMSYPAGAEPRGVLKDLQRLLSISGIG